MAGESVFVEITGATTVTVPWSEGMNAQQALERAYDAAPGSISYGLQYFGGQLGYLVFAINETYDTFGGASDPFYYWEFLVDGSPAAKGVDNTILDPGVTISFVYTLWESSEAGLGLKAKHAARGGQG